MPFGYGPSASGFFDSPGGSKKKKKKKLVKKVDYSENPKNKNTEGMAQPETGWTIPKRAYRGISYVGD